MTNSGKAASGNMPLVSVFVGCYNHSRFVLETLESVRSQTYPSIELIIWDDRSTDESPEVIRSWISDNSIECVFIEHAVNRGLCKSLNEALALASGKYVAMVSADDLWMPERIARQVEILENAASNVGVGCLLKQIENFSILPRDHCLTYFGKVISYLQWPQ
jgi:glycosyltransferase involved in cell wall biosynthesis